MALRHQVIPVLSVVCLAATAAVAQDDDGTRVIRLDQFGVGNEFRPGGMTAIRLILTSNLDDITPCWVQWEVPNAEGDLAEYGREVHLTPGSPKPVWLYAPISPHADADTVWSVRVFELRDNRRRGELWGERISPQDVGSVAHDIDKALIGVVGRARMGLSDFLNTWQRRDNPPGAHEETRVVYGLLPEEMPDQWEGLMSFEAIVWADAVPQQLGAEAASALREYIRRGGHLVIILPEGNPWGLGQIDQTWLEDLLVGRNPRRDEGVMLAELMPVLSKSKEAVRDIEVSIRVFKEIGDDYDAIDNGYEPLIALPDGRVVVIQRLVDFGRITIVGIDVASGQISAMRLPQADVFWNRVLGRRADTPYADEVMAMQNATPRRLSRGTVNDVVVGSGRIFDPYVNKPGQAQRGLLAAMLLFGLYFAAATGGFFVLRHNGYARHSWLVFAATAAFFTAVAWGGVRVLRQQRIELNHVTVLDLAVRPDDQRLSAPLYQRAVSWGSIYLPSYGKTRVSIDSNPLQRDLLLTWTDPEKLQERFPNVDRYPIDVARSFADYEIPVRATATQIYANWLGSVDPEWGGTIWVDQDDPIRVIGTGINERLSGTLLHDLPGRLSNVRLIWITSTRADRRRYAPDIDGEDLPWVTTGSGQMLNLGHFWGGGEPWSANTPLALAGFQPAGNTRLDDNIYEDYIKGQERGFNIPGAAMRAGRPLDSGQIRSFFEMLSMYHQLTPPKYRRRQSKDPDTAVISRKLGRELDLSPWFIRPCLILIGYMENSSTPVPFQVDGTTPRSDGLTIVRWVYPLPVDEDRIAPRAE